MEDYSIYDLLMVIRGLSNEITVRGLASDLGISYSTLARCKNGVWPRSVTFDSMRGVLDKCRVRFFDGDGTALAQSVILGLRGRDVNTMPFETTLETEGYEAFVECLMARAANRTPAVAVELATPDSPPPQLSLTNGSPSHSTNESSLAQDDIALHQEEQDVVKTELEPPLAKPPADEQVQVAPTQASPPKRAQHIGERLLLLPIAVILVVGLFGLSLSALYGWAVSNPVWFIALSTLIALSPALVGTLIDAPLAWHAYKHDHPHTPFAFETYTRVVKYGDPCDVVPGKGRFNLTAAYYAYQPVCNICGMMCYLSLMVFLQTLPGFSSFFFEHEWTEFLKAGIVVAFLVAYGQMRDQWARPAVREIGPAIQENPDNYLPTRVHVWANTLHLVWTISLLIVLLLGLVAYSVVNLRALAAPPLMLWPFLQGILFFAYSCTSPLAIRIRATAAGILGPGVCATSLGFALLCVGCYLPSWGTVALCVLAVACVAASFAWGRALAKERLGDWIAQNSESRSYAIAIATCILALFVIGIATSAFF